MKLATFEYSGSRRIGLVRQDKVLDLAAIAPTLPKTMEEFLALGPEAMAAAKEAGKMAKGGLVLAAVRLCAPVSRPRKFLGIGGNFKSHLAEVKAQPPANQIWFNKQVTCVS